MTQTTLVGPDLFAWYAANPLLGFFPRKLDFLECGDYLRHDPSAAWGGQLPADLREDMANDVKRAFAPTKIALQAVMALQNMLYTGLRARDPRAPANRRWPYQTGELLGHKLDELPWFPTYAAGATLRGITGCGKSLCIERFLLPRFEQVYVHEKRDDCAWSEMRQLSYLIVPMPADGSRGGLLLEIAMQMDARLGTEYATQLRTRFKTVEKGLVAILHWLSLHRCGLLVVEEAQERHATVHVFGSEFVTFFLRVMNFGIPLALVGNPLAFKHIDAYSQDVRRFSEGGRFIFDPVSDHRSVAWTRDLIPAVWGFNVFDESDEFIEDLPLRLWNMTGGIPDALCRLRRVSLTEAISLGGQRVEAKHVQLAYMSPVYAPMRQLVEVFVKKDASLLSKFKDIPIDYFREKWEAECREEAKRVALKKLKAGETSQPEAKPSDADGPDDRRGPVFLQGMQAKQAALDAKANGLQPNPGV